MIEQEKFPLSPLMVLLLYVFLLHTLSIKYMLDGLFKSRAKLFEYSNCTDVQKLNQLYELSDPQLGASGSCWNHSKYRRVMLILLDALRFDFVITHNMSEPYQTPPGFSEHPKDAPPPPYVNKLTILHELAKEKPDQALLFRAFADTPTLTTNRIEAIATSNFLMFMDSLYNFNIYEVSEDNLLNQIKRQSRHAIFFGDDTWISLFPDVFDRAVPVYSFNIRDTTTCDEPVKKGAIEELKNNDWDLFIGHALGIDHIGHLIGPNHPLMVQKLSEINLFLKELIERIDEDTLLTIIGDHGMTESGSHGSSSQEETSTVMFFYSKRKNAFSRSNDFNSLSQITLIPTLSLVLGIPIPYSSLGLAIPEVLGNEEQFDDVLFHLHLSASQIVRYLSSLCQADPKILEEIGPHVLDPYLELESQHREYLRQYPLNSSHPDKKHAATQLIQLYKAWNSHSTKLFYNLWSVIDISKCTYTIVITLFTLLLLIILSLHPDPYTLCTQLRPHLYIGISISSLSLFQLLFYRINVLSLPVALSAAWPILVSLFYYGPFARAPRKITFNPYYLARLLKQTLSFVTSFRPPPSPSPISYTTVPPLLIALILSSISEFLKSAILSHQHVLHFTLSSCCLYFVWLEWLWSNRLFNSQLWLVLINTIVSFSYLGSFSNYFDRLTPLHVYIYTDFALLAYLAFQFYFSLVEEDPTCVQPIPSAKNTNAPSHSLHKTSCQKIKLKIWHFYHILNVLLVAIYWFAVRRKFLQSSWIIRVLVPRFVYTSSVVLVVLHLVANILYRLKLPNLLLHTALPITHITLSLSNTALLLLGESSPAVLILFLGFLLCLRDNHSHEDTNSPSSNIPLASRVLVLSLFCSKLFYVTGHTVSLSELHIIASFIGVDKFNYHLCCMLLLYNTFCFFFICPLWVLRLTRKSRPRDSVFACIFLLTIGTAEFFMASISAVVFRYHVKYVLFFGKWTIETIKLMIGELMMAIGAILYI